MVLNLVIAFPREIPHHNVFVVTVAEEGLAVLLLILINILWCVRPSHSEHNSTLTERHLSWEVNSPCVAFFCSCFLYLCPATDLLAFARHHLFASNPVLRVVSSHRPFLCQKCSFTWQHLPLQDSSWSCLPALSGDLDQQTLCIFLAVIPKTKLLWGGPDDFHLCMPSCMCTCKFGV